MLNLSGAMGTFKIDVHQGSISYNVNAVYGILNAVYGALNTQSV